MDIQQRVEYLINHPAMAAIWEYLDEVLLDILASAILIQQIPAPTFNELVRANHVLSRFGACGLTDTGIDRLSNAAGRRPGSAPELPALLVSAHTDTVFPDGTDLTIRHENDGRISGPGLGDNSLGVAALVALADILRQFDITTRRDIWFLANSREEGLGDLGGIRGFYDTHRDRLGLAIVIEGLALGRVFHRGIAVRRLRIRMFGEGGHSWQHFGRPSAIHHLLKLGAQITQLDVPETPRTTFNIGLISGGQSVNTIASEAEFYIDLRSESTDTLHALEQRIRTLVEDNSTVEGITTQIEIVGDRPAGELPADHPLVRGATSALRAVGIEATYETGSTDANLLLANDLPAVTLGITTGGNAHQHNEYINTGPLKQGMRQVILLALAAAEWEPA
ncbi:MAG: M20/M25/M40 family metallo-hydrolase [Anaerolineae bacterium]